MYLPAHFAESRPQVLRDFIAAHPLGLLVTQNRTGGIDANSVPFFLDADDDASPGVLRAHVARANPLWKEARDDVDALVVFQGPHGYVSPAWYPSKAEHGKVVPTWNYVMVQARGRLRAVDDKAWLRAFVTRLTDHHEGGRAAPWAVTDAPADFIDNPNRRGRRRDRGGPHLAAKSRPATTLSRLLRWLPTCRNATSSRRGTT